MLSKNKIKQIRQLKQKKFRNLHGLFVVEGKKSVNEFLKNNTYELESLYHNKDYQPEGFSKGDIVKVSDTELQKISFLKTAQQVVAVFKTKSRLNKKESNLIIALDNIQDPGNLGTIIRLADWFGVTKIVCSLNTVDCFNPKVVQATMGSLNRVELIYTNLTDYLEQTKKPIYAAIMNGENVYKAKLDDRAILLMGNEANGISQNNLDLVKYKITIPRIGNIQKTESLNVATATAILLSEFKRN
jgi:TrmH family RNA methyltransferase